MAPIQHCFEFLVPELTSGPSSDDTESDQSSWDPTTSEADSSDSDPKPTRHFMFKYETLTPWFAQDDPRCDEKTFDYTIENFGLKRLKKTENFDCRDDPIENYSEWEFFMDEVKGYKKDFPPPKYRIKLLWLARHGQGVHNECERQYGRADWDDFWSKQDGNGTDSWVDAKLTPTGIQQAQLAAETWEGHIRQRVPLPKSHYVSPLDRCLDTARRTFGALGLSDALTSPYAYRPIVKELARETLGVHTCDRRSTRSAIAERYPEVRFEEGFSEEDKLWKADHRETDEETDQRIKRLLDDVFSNDDKKVISFTIHSGTISSFLRVLGHRPFRVKTGAILPVMVKAEMITADKNGSPRCQ